MDLKFPIRTCDAFDQINSAKREKHKLMEKINSRLKYSLPDCRENYFAGLEDAKKLCELSEFLDKYGNWPESYERMFGKFETKQERSMNESKNN